MPILDPNLQFYLIEETLNNDGKKQKSFYLRYLRVASRNINKNFNTLNASKNFKEDLKNIISVINYIFSLEIINIKEMVINNYQYLYDQIPKSFNNSNVEGRYFKQTTDSSKIFFQPKLYFPKNHSWYFTDSPIAILSINFKENLREKPDLFFNLIKLEIDLLQASGLTLVFCFNYSVDYSDYLIKLIERDQFSEIHCNFKEKEDIEHFLTNHIQKNKPIFKSFEGYLYIYSPYLNKNSKNRMNLKKLKKMTRFYVFNFSSDFKNLLEPTKFVEIEEFKYYKTGFRSNFPKEIKVRLSNVPLYNNKKNDETFIPSKISFCYVSLNDFINWTDERIEIIMPNEENGSFIKYINFNDLHRIKRDLYARDTLLLADIDNETLKSINELDDNIKSIIDMRKNKSFKKDHFLRLFRNLNRKIEYASYAYAFINSSEETFYLHRPQLYTVFDAVNTLLGNTSFSQRRLIKRKKYLENLIEDKCNKDDFIHPDLQNVLSDSILRAEFNKVLNKKLSRPKNYFKNKDEIKKELERINNILKSKSIDENSKGVVYQVETGEGKTCIVAIIAAVLALKGKTIHIVSSNIKLSNRDYMDSFNFFGLLGIKSAVFLHENELPYYKAGNSDEYDLYYNTKNDEKKFDYYNASQFNNSSKMNFAVCGLDCNNNIPSNKPQIIFSTFVNFECFYLKMLEICPGYADDLFENCFLLIDEADSILIDEIANGTIVSKSMKSNMKDVLIFVYNNKKNDVKIEDTFNQVKEKWPKIEDLQLQDIERMYHEIDIVNQDEFKNGKKYYIEQFTVKSEKKKKRLIKKTINFLSQSAFYGYRLGKAFIKEIYNNLKGKEDGNNEEEDEEEDDYDEEEEEEEEMKDKIVDEDITVDEEKSEITFNYIVPFDYNHKGILEPNKEFSGFIQQFIAIKESQENDVHNMIIKDMSMSYLYVSHPIFVKLYNKVCGFTGTIGKEKDRQIFKKEYKLTIKKVPRNRPNKRVELPVILCTTLEERNRKIVSEIIEFHSKGNPVLAIFEDLNEIDEVKKLLIEKSIEAINIFNGKNEKLSAEEIAGKINAISLGTNVCGRGTNIKLEDNKKPLHVIISYYSSNSRVLKQAHGRTARQGRKGTSRIICLRNEFLFPKVFTDRGVKETVEEFRIKNQLQSEFIELFKITRPWIFDEIKDKQDLNKYIKIIRETKMNVNRIIAYNYEFPLQMSINTFLKIQSQKIVSLINCPNTKYTWILFQKYIRELILESWSLMINDVDKIFFEKKENKDFKKKFEVLNMDSVLNKKNIDEYNKNFDDIYKSYEKLLKENIDALLYMLLEYLPLTNENENACSIVQTFMHIFTKVINENQEKILPLFQEIPNAYMQYGSDGFITCQFGFRPYSLLSQSGARILQKNYKKLNYIHDPEIKYMKKMPNNKYSLLSITEKIDDIFNFIFKKINNFIGENTFLKFFLKRTLCGCEFGICCNFDYEVTEINSQNCLFDKDPLLLFTLNVKSLFPILAGILIFGLLYIAYLIKEIIECIAALPEKFLIKEILIKGLIACCEVVGKDLSNKILTKICYFLDKKFNSQINSENFPEVLKKVFLNIKNLADLTMGTIANKLNEKLSPSINVKIKKNWLRKIKSIIDPRKVMKVSFYLLLCFASFIVNFVNRKDALECAKKDSSEYNNHIGANDMNNVIDNLANADKSIVQKSNSEVNDIEKAEFDEQDYKKLEEDSSKTFLYKFRNFILSSKLVKLSNFIKEKGELIKDFATLALDVRSCIYKGKIPKRCLRFKYPAIRGIISQQIRIMATNKLPSILNLVGYSTYNKNVFIFVENKGNQTLKNLIKNETEIDETQKLIIAYGIAKALEILHAHKVVLRNINTSNIVIDSNYHPYLSDFSLSIQTEIKPSYLIYEETLNSMEKEFIAPELKTKEFIIISNSDPQQMDDTLIEKCIKNQNSYKIDVYSFGAVLHSLFTGKINSEMETLINKCLDENADKRPSFKQICPTIEKISETKSINKNVFNDYKAQFITSELQIEDEEDNENNQNEEEINDNDNKIEQIDDDDDESKGNKKLNKKTEKQKNKKKKKTKLDRKPKNKTKKTSSQPKSVESEDQEENESNHEEEDINDD